MRPPGYIQLGGEVGCTLPQSIHPGMHGVRLQLRRPRCDVGTSATVHSRRGDGGLVAQRASGCKGSKRPSNTPGFGVTPTPPTPFVNPLAYFRARLILPYRCHPPTLGFARALAR